MTNVVLIQLGDVDGDGLVEVPSVHPRRAGIGERRLLNERPTGPAKIIIIVIINTKFVRTGAPSAVQNQARLHICVPYMPP